MRDTDASKIVSLAPSVNLTPVGNQMMPTPYNVVDYGGHDEGYAATVFFTGQRVMRLASLTQHVHGDEAGTGGGAKSGTHGGVCEPIQHAAQFRVEGSPVIRHLDRCWMNNRNTVGECQFTRDTATYEPPPDTDRIAGSVATRVNNEPQIMSDAAPDPSLSRPGAQLAYNDTGQRFTPPAPTAVPPVSPPQPIPGTPTSPTPRPPPGRPSGSVLLRRFGIWSLPLRDLLRRQTMTDQEVEDEDRAMGVILSPTGVKVIADQNLLWGRRPLKSPLDILNVPPSKYGLLIQPEDRVAIANDILSARAGRRVDIRTLNGQEVAALLEEKPTEQPSVDGGGEGARISEEERRKRCQVDKYSIMQPICAARGMTPHHIVPDYALGVGNRGQRETDKPEYRIPGLPGFKDGMCICVSGNAKQPKDVKSNPGDLEREHYWAHAGDVIIGRLGAANTPKGTLAIGEIISVSIAATIGAVPACVVEVTKAVDQQYQGRDRKVLGRTTQNLPTGDAGVVLRRGATQDNWQTFVRRP